ncbi:unnamed protein product [Cochlearia groenlandica]
MDMLLDAGLGKRYSEEGVKKLFKAAKMCVETQIHKRPVMSLVKSMVTEAAVFPVGERPRVAARRSI